MPSVVSANFEKQKNTLDLSGFSKLVLSDGFSLCWSTYTEFIPRKVTEFFDKINANINIQNPSLFPGENIGVRW